MGYVEAKLLLPIGKKLFETEALTHVLSITEYHKRVPIAIGTSITDLATNSLDPLDFSQV